MDLIRSAAVVREVGRIAQLGERCPYKAEVTGSIPVPPTNEHSSGKEGQEKSCRDEVPFLAQGLTGDR
jgi:hypothetical protein